MIKQIKLKLMANRVFKYIRLPKIPIGTYHVKEVGNYTAEFYMHELRIRTVLFHKAAIIDNYYINEYLPDLNNYQKEMFFLFHEIGHYLHYWKYHKHFMNIYCGRDSENRKCEDIANKIAHVLLRKFRIIS